MYLDDFLESAFLAVDTKHNFHEKITAKLLPLKSTLSPNCVENVVEKITKAIPNGIIAGVDSGFVSKKLSFIDLVMVRTVGAIFYYANGEIEKADYYPRAFSFPEPILLKSGLEKDEEQQSISLERLKKEVNTSIEIIEKYTPKFLFVDGSIVPQYQDKPRNDSKINEDYLSAVGMFQKFYSTAEKNNCTIISCVEDSRGTRFKQLLQEEILPKHKMLSPESLNDSFDSALLDYFLTEGERTFCFPYTKKTESHAILKDLNPKWSKNVFAFYLKASNFDKPLRVEFISKGLPKSESDRIASVVYALSSLHREYTYPSVLIEADMRASLNEQDISVVYDKLIDKLGPKVRMRRNSRPFK
jgi:hypothetical protein